MSRGRVLLTRDYVSVPEKEEASEDEGQGREDRRTTCPCVASQVLLCL